MGVNVEPELINVSTRLAGKTKSTAGRSREGVSAQGQKLGRLSDNIRSGLLTQRVIGM